MKSALKRSAPQNNVQQKIIIQIKQNELTLIKTPLFFLLVNVSVLTSS